MAGSAARSASARSRTGTPVPPTAATNGIPAGESVRARLTRGSQKDPAQTLTPITTQGLANEVSEDDDDDDEQQAGSSKDASDGEDARNQRRASSRIAAKAAKAAVREIAAQTAPSPPAVSKRLPKARAAATPSADTASSPGGTPAPLQDSASVAKIADVASKTAKARKGPYNRSAPSVPSTRELLTGIEASGSADVVEVLVTDPNDMIAGYKQLEEWIYGGLDMYRDEFHPLLFPVFCHFYIDLVFQGFKESALTFYQAHSGPLRERHANDIHHLSSLLLPQHVIMSSFAQRFRSEKYVIRMSRAGFALFVGWLTEGTGGEAMGAGEGIIPGREGAGRRARFTVLKIVHGSLKFDVTSASTNAVQPSSWVEATGLIRSLIPTPNTGFRMVNGKQVTGSLNAGDPTAFNAQQGDLKLGPAPLVDALREEAERVIKEEDDAMVVDGAETNGNSSSKPSDSEKSGPSVLDLSSINGTTGLAPPLMADILPQAASFRSVDVKREVERVRDARKRIKLDPSILQESLQNAETNGYPQTTATTSKISSAALPSICAYTFHDALDGINCSSFSEDSTYMAAGFNESYIRLWSLKKEKLRGLKSEFNLNSITDPYALRKLREKHGNTTRKLIGHSGPVFATAFDSVNGTSAPPKFLLSASADHTTRLWSLETLTNVVAYRGHKNPVWDVQWSPTGTYFATGSRDRTARLWSTERINALRVFAGHLSDVDCVRFHPNSAYLATGSSDMTCRLWDVQRGTAMRVFIGHCGPVTSIAMSPDGRYLASASTDLSINLWDLSSGRKIKSMMGHNAPINSLSFSACTNMLVSGSSDWTVRCWNVKSAGGLPSSSGKLNGTLPDGALDDKDSRQETVDLLQTFPTKRTSIINVQFTPRNLCLVAGTFMPPESS